MNKYIKILFFCYLYLTLIEWIIHKHFMHAKPKSIFNKFYNFICSFDKSNTGINSHIVHHIEVENNMEINRDLDIHDGLIMSLNDLINQALIIFIGFFFIFKKYNLFQNNLMLKSLGISFIVSSIYCCIWNTIHPLFHNLDLKIKFKEGMSSFKVFKNKTNPIILWLYKNHTLHHLIKGKNKGNFNIVLPGADFIFNTYNNKIDNKNFCKYKEKNKKGCKLVKNSKLGGSVNKCKQKINDLCFKDYKIENFQLN